MNNQIIILQKQVNQLKGIVIQLQAQLRNVGSVNQGPPGPPGPPDRHSDRTHDHCLSDPLLAFPVPLPLFPAPLPLLPVPFPLFPAPRPGPPARCPPAALPPGPDHSPHAQFSPAP